MLKITLLIFFALVSYCGTTSVSTVANEFVFAFFKTSDFENSPDGPTGVVCVLLVSNNNNGPANVTITSSYELFSTISVSVATYSVLEVLITPVNITAQYSGNPSNSIDAAKIIVENKGIRLQSDIPVAVYAHTEDDGTYFADTFLVIPVDHLASQYLAVTSDKGGDNIIAVVAYQNDTQVTIGKQTVTLNALQVASVNVNLASLSGLSISANKAIAALSGAVSGRNEDDQLLHNYEAVMLLPIESWGTSFLAVPFANLGASWYRVVASMDNTVVSLSGMLIAKLNAGEYAQFQATYKQIDSNYPIEGIQIGEKTWADPYYNYGGPFFIQLPSTDKWSNADVLFQPTGNYGYHWAPLVFYVRIAVRVDGIGSILLDGKSLNSSFRCSFDTDLCYSETQVQNTTHSVRSTNSTIRFSVISYTYGYLQGSGFACGYNLPPPTTNPPSTSTSTTKTTTTSGCPAVLVHSQAVNSCLFASLFIYLYRKVFGGAQS